MDFSFEGSDGGDEATVGYFLADGTCDREMKKIVLFLLGMRVPMPWARRLILLEKEVINVSPSGPVLSWP